MKASLVLILFAGLAVIEYSMAYPQQQYGQEFDDELPQGYPKQDDDFLAEQQRPQHESDNGVLDFEMAEIQAEKMVCTAFVPQIIKDFKYEICMSYKGWFAIAADILKSNESCAKHFGKYAKKLKPKARNELRAKLAKYPKCRKLIKIDCDCN